MHLKMSDQLVRQGAVELVFGLTLPRPAYKYAIFNNGFNFTAVENKEAPGNAGAF